MEKYVHTYCVVLLGEKGPSSSYSSFPDLFSFKLGRNSTSSPPCEYNCTIRLQPVSFCNQGHDIMWISRTECILYYYCLFWDPDHDAGSEHMEWAFQNAGSGLILLQKRTAWTQNVILMACFSPHAPIGLTDFRHDLHLSFRHFWELPAYQPPETEA